MKNNRIAIIGMSVRSPEAENLAEYWQLISEGKDTFSRLDSGTVLQLKARGVATEDLRFVPVHSSLRDPFSFDAEFFGCTPREAQLMDPQHRIFLEQVYAALEDAGIDAICSPYRIGLIAGTGVNWYRDDEPHGERSQDQYFQRLFSEEKDHLALRVAYKLNLRGPTFTVQSACSTSLLAVHLAANSLRLDEAEVMVAGGVNVRLSDSNGYVAEEGGVLSSEGICRPFESDSQGTVWASGAGVVVLKSLPRALEDGDHIYAVIEGSATGNDGKHKVGYSASSASGQEEVMREALRRSGIEPNQVRYIEAHGTGTVLGDAVEISALSEVYGRSEDLPTCWIGTVKSNIGHPEGASGILGLIRAAQSVSKSVVPNHKRWRQQRGELSIGNRGLRLAVATPVALDWSQGSYVGVHSLGLGGTNVHMILGSVEPTAEEVNNIRAYPFLLSAERAEDLPIIASRFITFLSKNPAAATRDIAYTLATGRRHLKFRAVICARSLDELLAGMERVCLSTGREGAVYLQSDSPVNFDLEMLAGWAKGESFSFQAIFSDEKCRKVSLPSYPFKRTQHVRNGELRVEKRDEAVTSLKAGKGEGSVRVHDIERALLQHVSQVLGINGVSSDSDFLILGGDSLLATQVIARVRRDTGVRIPMKIFLQCPTLGAIANQVAEGV